MSPADRVALVDRLARARAWNALAKSDQDHLRQRVSADIDELEIAQEQIARIGWMLIEVSDEERAPA